jgi:predicted metal-dependent peptidase
MQLDPQTARMVSASLLRMCSRSAFFAALALFARFQASQQVPTAATDGRDVFINPEFFAALATPEQDFVLLHEVLHAALLHVPRRSGRDPQLWNIAADIVVNGMLLREGYRLPAGGLREPRLEHLSAEEIYELLLHEQQQQPTLVSLDLLAEAPDDSTAGSAASPAEGSQQARPATLEHHWRQALEQARIVAESSVAGTLPASLARELNSLEASRIDWRSRLWRYLVQTPTDFQHFDRRFVGQGLYLETLSGESVHVHVAVDTSGSVNGAELTAFASEVQAILRAYPHLRCDLYYADAALHGPYRLTPNAALPPPIGGGGTDFRPFFEQISKARDPWGATVAIYLTDGYGSCPDAAPRYPVLWVVAPGGRDLGMFPFGETVRLLASTPAAAETPFR